MLLPRQSNHNIEIRTARSCDPKKSSGSISYVRVQQPPDLLLRAHTTNGISSSHLLRIQLHAKVSLTECALVRRAPLQTNAILIATSMTAVESSTLIDSTTDRREPTVNQLKPGLRIDVSRHLTKPYLAHLESSTQRIQIDATSFILNCTPSRLTCACLSPRGPLLSTPHGEERQFSLVARRISSRGLGPPKARAPPNLHQHPKRKDAEKLS